MNVFIWVTDLYIKIFLRKHLRNICIQFNISPQGTHFYDKYIEQRHVTKHISTETKLSVVSAVTQSSADFSGSTPLLSVTY